MANNQHHIRFIPVLALLLGSAIGAGILALPIPLGLAGFVPSILMMVLYGSLLLFTAWIFACETIEANSSTFDLNSLFEHYIHGKFHWVITGLCMFVLYGMMIAYLTGAAKVFCSLLNLKGDSWVLSMSIASVMVAICCFNLDWICRFNMAFVIFMILAMTGMVIYSEHFGNFDALSYRDWQFSICTIPVVVGTFQFHFAVPTLCNALGCDKRKIAKLLITGFALLFLIYALWFHAAVANMPLFEYPDDGIYLGVTKNIPISEVRSMLGTYYFNLPANIPMSNLLRNKYFTFASALFAIIAVFTSFIGNGVAMKNMLEDIFVHTFGKTNRLLILCIAFIPPTIISTINPNIFINAVSIVSGIGCVSLYCILPCYIAIKNKGYSTFIRICGWFFLVLAVIAFLYSLLSTMNVWRINSKVESYYQEKFVSNPEPAIRDLDTEESHVSAGGNRQGAEIPSESSTR